MRLATFASNGSTRFGALQGDYLVDLPGAHAAGVRAGIINAAPETPAFLASAIEFLEAGKPARELARQVLTFAAEPEAMRDLVRLGLAVLASEAKFLPPVPRPAKIICVGRNYKEHVTEMEGTLPEHPVLFAKFSNTLIGHGAPIVLPAVSSMVDYEAELAVVIGRRGRDIPVESALDYVAGYTIFNDVSVRDWQRRTPQWLQGKTFDGTGPIGPALVTLDELSDPHTLDVQLRLNGEVMQSASTSAFIFNVPRLIHYISQIATLEPGDVIATGTPGGVGAARKPPVFLKAGDTVEVEISGLGVLRNPVTRPA